MRKDQSGWKWVHFWVALITFMLMTPPHLFAMPSGGTVTSGQGAISQTDANNMRIDQATQKMIINWQKFGISPSEAVRFFQPNSTSVALNRVIGGSPSEIYGLLSANGRIILINQAGIVVGATGQINANSVTLSTLDVADEDFLKGKQLVFQKVGGQTLAGILNQGSIKSADGGSVSLIAPSVKNEGTITANMGKVYIGGGEQVTLNFDGENLISFVVEDPVNGVVLDKDGKPVESIIDNKGTITADGGEVVLSAKSALDSIKAVVNNDGVIQAQSLVNQGGVIKLLGGEEGVVANSGTLDASGKEAGAKGGTVQVLGDKVGLLGNSAIDVSGDAGGGTALVGGDFQGKNSEIQNSQYTYVGPQASIKADAITEGDGGKAVVWSDGLTNFKGSISAKGGVLSGDGGFVEVSGKEGFAFSLQGGIDTSAPNGKVGTLLLDPRDITITSTAGEYNGAAGSLAPPAGTGDWLWARAEDGAAFDGRIGYDVVNSLLNTNSLTLQASRDIFVDAGANTITLARLLTLDASNNISLLSGSFDGIAGLTLKAGHDITLAGTFNTSGGNLTIQFGQAGAGGILTNSASFTGANFASATATGGAGADTFNISAGTFATLTGGNGNDVFNISGGDVTGTINGGFGDDKFVLGVRINGSVIGGPGVDELNLTAPGLAAQTITLTNAIATNKFSGTATAIGGAGGFTGISKLYGKAGDTLIGLNVDSTWTGTSYTDGLQTLTLSGIDRLQGGSGADTFNLSSGTFASISGGDGNNTYNISGTADVTGSVSGGAGTDLFNLDKTITGSIAGGAGADTLDIAGIGGAQTVTLTGAAAGNEFGGTTSAAGGGFTGISSIIGKAGDTLTGLNVASTWTQTSYTENVTSQQLTLAGFDTLAGGSGVDIFNISAGTFYNLSGGGGADVFNISGGSVSYINGGAGDDVVNVTGGDVTGRIFGGDGNDRFVLSKVITGGIAGEGGADMLDIAGIAGAQTVTLTGVAAGNEFDGITSAAAGGFTGINSLTGKAGDTLTGLNVNSTWTETSYTENVTSQTLTIAGINNFQGGSDVDTFNIAVSTLASVKGGAGNDVFNISGTGDVSGSLAGEAGDDLFNLDKTVTASIDGGAGADTLDIAGIAGAQTVDLGAGTITGFGGTFSGIESFVGDNANDILQLASVGANTVAINGANDGVIAGGPSFTDFVEVKVGSQGDSFNFGAGGSLVTLDTSNTGIGNTVTIQNINVANLNTSVKNYNVTLFGSNSNVLNAATFNNTGIITLGTAGTDSTTFAGGLDTRSASMTNIAGQVKTPGAKMDMGAVNLTADATLTGANIDLRSTVDGGFNLVLSDAGTSTLWGVVGGGVNPASLTTDAVVLKGGAVTTTGAQTYRGAVTLGNNTILTGNNIDLQSTVDGGFGLTLADAGTSILRGAVGATTALASLTTNAVNINGGMVKTAGAQTYNGAVTLGGDTALTGLGITFKNTVNGLLGTEDLSVAGGAGAVRFEGIVGGGAGIGALSSTGGSFTNLALIDAADISLNHTGAVTLTGNLKSDGAVDIVGSSIAINGGINAAGNVSLNSPGAVTQTAAINASGLELLGAGSYALTLGNDVNTLAANTTNTISFRDVDDLVIGTVNATAGLTSTGNVTLNAGGAVSQTGVITAPALELLGAGSYALTLANDVDTLAANTTNNLSFRDVDDLVIGTVNATAGLTSTGKVTLNAGGNLEGPGTITAPSADLQAIMIGMTAQPTVNMNGNNFTLTLSGKNGLGVSGQLDWTAGNILPPVGNISAPGAVIIGNFTYGLGDVEGVTAALATAATLQSLIEAALGASRNAEFFTLPPMLVQIITEEEEEEGKRAFLWENSLSLTQEPLFVIQEEPRESRLDLVYLINK